MAVILNPILYTKAVTPMDKVGLEYGMNEVKMLEKHFSGLPGFSSVSFEHEFPLFKKFVMRSLASNSSNMADLCRIVILGHQKAFPILLPWLKLLMRCLSQLLK